jgi:hypothetical protein
LLKIGRNALVDTLRVSSSVNSMGLVMSNIVCGHSWAEG